MRNRVLLSAGAIALVAASCAQPEPQVLSEAPRSASSAEQTSPSETTDRASQPGRFIARCATEADGGTPGMTFFTDGTQNVTDHCLSRYYIGVQPAPGALYVPDAEAGSFAPTPDTQTQTPTYEWTPAQPRTDAGLDSTTDPDRETRDEDETTDEGEPTEGQPGETTPDETGTPVTSPEETSPTTPPTTPGETDPSDPTDTGEPGETGAPGTGDPDTSTPGSSEPAPPTTVPTVTEVPQEQQETAPTSVTSTSPPGLFGSTGSTGSEGSTASDGSTGSQSAGLPRFRWPSSVLPTS